MKKLKNKNYGFTLIELLATIVILGLLALIVTPGIAKVIRNSKINTAKASLEGYIREIENAVALYMTDTGNIPNSIDQLEIDGKNIDKLENVSVVFEHGEVTKVLAEIDGIYCRYKVGQDTACQDIPFTADVIYENIGDIVYYDPVNNETCTTYTESNSASGVKEGCLKWHVLSENEDGTVNLILDHNIASDVKWTSKNDYVSAGGDGNAYDSLTYVSSTDGNTYVAGLNDKGPITAVTKLEEVTSNWHESLIRSDKYEDYNNTTLKYTVDYSGIKARLPEANEIAQVVGHTTYNQNTSNSWFYLESKNQTHTVGYGKEKTVSDYAWLYNNLNGGSSSTDTSNTRTCLYYGCTQNLGNPTGDYVYWTSTSVAGTPHQVWRVHYNGILGIDNAANIRRGIRPVITLSN